MNANQLASFGPALRHFSAVPEPVEGKTLATHAKT